MGQFSEPSESAGEASFIASTGGATKQRYIWIAAAGERRQKERRMQEVIKYLTDNSALISVVSATIALGSCFASVFGYRLQTKSIDFNNCLEVVKQLAEAQRRVRDAANDDIREFEIIELLNLMEALALLINRRRIGRSASEYTAHFLEESWASLKSNDDILPLVEKSISGADTYSQLVAFSTARKNRIAALVQAYSSPN